MRVQFRRFSFSVIEILGEKKKPDPSLHAQTYIQSIIKKCPTLEAICQGLKNRELTNGYCNFQTSKLMVKKWRLLQPKP